MEAYDETLRNNQMKSPLNMSTISPGGGESLSQLSIEEQIHRVCERLLKNLKAEYQDDPEELVKHFLEHKIRLQDLEFKTLQDFRVQNESYKISEVKYNYYQKKKKAKMRIMRKLLHDKKKINEKALRETDNTSKKILELSEFLKSPVSQPPAMDQTFFETQNDANQKIAQSNLFTLTQAEVIQDQGRNTLPISKTAKYELPKLLQKQTPSILNMNELVVNRLPELKLAKPLNASSTLNLTKQLANQKMRFLSKIENTKNKLSNQMDSSANNLRERILRRERDEQKLLKIYVEEEYERHQRAARESEKLRKALSYRVKIQKTIENQQMKEYRNHLKEMHAWKQRKEERERSLSQRQYEEINKDIKVKLQKMELLEKIEKENYSQARKKLREIEERFKQVELYQSEKIAGIQSSRNQHFDKVRKVQTSFAQISEQKEIKKISSGLERYGRVDVKRERASEERERLSLLLHQNIEGRLSERKKNRGIVEKHRDQWSRSVLEMHRRQSEQVRQRNYSVYETVNIKKTYDTLKKDDQVINYQDIIKEYKDDLNKVKIKHYNLSKSNERSRLALEKLQVKQRAQEMRKKTEMFENLWSQTLLPRNKLGDVQFEKDLKEPVGNILSKAKEHLMKLLGKPLPPPKLVEEEGSNKDEEEEL